MRSHFSYIFFLLIIFLLFSPSIAISQEPGKDTTGFMDRVIEKFDTLVNAVVPDSVLEKWSEQPFDSMLFRNKDSRLKRELYNLIVRSNKDTTKLPTQNTFFAAMDGRIIRSIDFMNVDMFAPSITDTGFIPATWFERMSNSAHQDTRSIILERYLLFKPGDRLDVFLAAENERILRDLSFIMDAWFVARPVKGSPDSIDILLVSQDRFPIGAEARIEKTTEGLAGITHENVLGYGHQLSATTYFDTRYSPHVGYGLSYGTTNIAGTFTSGKLDYLKKWNQESFVLDFTRDFRAISLESAGGFRFEKTTLTQNIHLLDTIYDLANFSYSITDLWTGRLLTPVSRQTQLTRTGIYLSARFTNYNNIQEPAINDAYLYPYMDKIRALISIGISSQGFRKDNMIYTFGRTEDVPFGYQIELTSGFEWLQNKSRPYLSIGGSFGTYFNNSSYLFARIQRGTFFYKGNKEQGAFRIQANYFSRLYRRSRFQYRNFCSVLFSKGSNRYPGEYITLSNRRGIEGLTSKSLRGNDKLVLNLESVVFSPYIIYGFRFAFFGGLDLGILRRESNDVRLFSGISAGVRIRNDQLVFNTIVIKLAFYPGRPSDAAAENFIIDYMPRARFPDFLPDRPELVPYQ